MYHPYHIFFSLSYTNSISSSFILTRSLTAFSISHSLLLILSISHTRSLTSSHLGSNTQSNSLSLSLHLSNFLSQPFCFSLHSLSLLHHKYLALCKTSEQVYASITILELFHLLHNWNSCSSIILFYKQPLSIPIWRHSNIW